MVAEMKLVIVPDQCLLDLLNQGHVEAGFSRLPSGNPEAIHRQIGKNHQNSFCYLPHHHHHLPRLYQSGMEESPHCHHQV